MALAGAMIAVPTTARAQQSGFVVDRFEPAERGSDWFTLDSLDLRSQRDARGKKLAVFPAVGLTGDYSFRSLAVYNSDGSLRTPIVDNQMVLHAGASLAFLDRFRVGVNLPIQLLADGSAGVLRGQSYAAPASQQAVGDLRVAADVRVFGTHGDAFTAAVGAQLFLPTGDQASYMSDGSTRVMPRAQVAGDVGLFTYAARLAFQYRGLEQSYAGSPIGSEFAYALSAGARLVDGKLLIGPELFGSTVISDGNAVFARQSSPVEGILGAHLRAGCFVIGAGVGAGLTRGFGAPAARTLLSIEWAPPWDKPEPAVAPPPDSDHDGVLDQDDACKDVPGVKSANPKFNGCPEDKDGDTIKNDVDACPDEPGKPNADPAKNGCPQAFVANGQIKILDQVRFKTASSDILPGKDSEEVLQAVLKVIKDHPEIKKLLVEGHTDNRGAAAYNKKLSTSRAASVVKWLVGHGVEASRLSSAGFGQERPLTGNDTDDGRQQNRRVEFHIEEKP